MPNDQFNPSSDLPPEHIPVAQPLTLGLESEAGVQTPHRSAKRSLAWALICMYAGILLIPVCGLRLLFGPHPNPGLLYLNCLLPILILSFGILKSLVGLGRISAIPADQKLRHTGLVILCVCLMCLGFYLYYFNEVF